MQSQPCTRTLDVTTHGEYKSRHSAAIAVHFWDSTYADCETCELIPEVHKPFTRTMAGYWAIIRALARVPWMANVTIYSEDEVCVTTLKLLLKDSIESSSPGNRHSHSHKDFVDRILADVKSRRAAGCKVKFSYRSVDNSYCGDEIALTRQLAQSILREASASQAASSSRALLPPSANAAGASRRR